MPYLTQATFSNGSPFRTPSAVIPLIMSGAALGLVLFHLATAGPGPTADEGADAHVFQLLIVGQAPFVVYFAFRWIPRLPAKAMFVLATQAAAALLALTPVVFFDL